MNVLLTNYHVLDGNFLRKNGGFEFEFEDGIKKTIKIRKLSVVISNKELDYTCIEIFESDNISYFLETNDQALDTKNEKEDIFIIQYPNGEEISFSQGKILKIKNEQNKNIIHSAPTSNGSSGSPIFLRNDDLRICGIHSEGIKNPKINRGISMNHIIKDIEKQINEIDFKKEDVINENDILQIIILTDGRIAGSKDNGNIIIYNKEDFTKNDLIIKAFKTNPLNISYFTQMSNQNLLVCGKSIKIIKLKINLLYMESYDYFQKIELKDNINILFNKAIEFDNNQILTCTNDSRICIFKKTNYGYSLGDTLSLRNNNKNKNNEMERTNIFKISENQFIATSLTYKCAKFFKGRDFKEDSIVDNIEPNGYPNSIIKYKNEFLLIGGITCLYLISINKDVNKNKLIKLNYISYSLYNLPNGNFIMGFKKIERNWALCESKIEDEKLEIIKEKNDAHSSTILNICKYYGILITYSEDMKIKFWYKE